MSLFKKYKTFIIAIIVVIGLIFNPTVIKACTGFAVYVDAENIFYGMNFDYSNTDMIFTIRDSESLKVFEMGFRSGAYWAYTVGMNSSGLFCSDQEQHPIIHNYDPKEPNELYMWDLHRFALYNFSSINQIENYLLDKRLRHHSSWASCHLLAADLNSDACIFEVGDIDDEIIPMSGQYMVMTNFRNADFVGVPYDEVYGVGADRYKTACEYIEENLTNFDFDDGIELLDQTAHSITLCSMLFLPLENEVFIKLKGEPSKIWRLSISEQFIETFQGFNDYLRIPLDSGITASQLQDPSQLDEFKLEATLTNIHPNPFSSSATIEYYLSRSSEVKISVFNLLGQELETLVDETISGGKHSESWTAEGLPDGIYVLRLKAGQVEDTKKLIILK